MKESGKFNWGEQRIYFDIPIDDMEKLKSIIMKIAGEAKLPIAFKHMDKEKTFEINKDGEETRFVANFATQEDAIKFYLTLNDSPEYQKLQADRKQNYGGIRLDTLAEYANGFRENRDAFSRIMAGSFNTEGMWEWKTGKKTLKISKEDFEVIRKKFLEAEKELEESKKKWGQVL